MQGHALFSTKALFVVDQLGEHRVVFLAHGLVDHHVDIGFFGCRPEDLLGGLPLQCLVSARLFFNPRKLELVLDVFVDLFVRLGLYLFSVSRRLRLLLFVRILRLRFNQAL